MSPRFAFPAFCFSRWGGLRQGLDVPLPGIPHRDAEVTMTGAGVQGKVPVPRTIGSRHVFPRYPNGLTGMKYVVL